ncbi:hypothetical protein IO99_13735 [Clostridium sulfidigenes]|uniref:HK97 gp10 family phage protein n=1 Tax=Clostridium sulfidigenes TaxID=318464 RepID=A0A084J9B8_9CLOT|nr:hypothetical protein [Clostridium sulfidigenes]KEZ85552.1 hypothetical protein IO99_13735 [Clostridium sulfidigenes]
MADMFDINQLTDFGESLVKLANEKMPKESKKFIRSEANKLNRKNKSVYKSKGIGEETGNLLKGFKSGKAYKFNGAWSARAFNSSPHAHLLDKGFIWKPHKGQKGEEKFIPGFNFMEGARKTFESQYYNDVEDFIDDVLEKGL